MSVIEEDYPGQLDEYRRQKLVGAAVGAVHRIVQDGSDGSCEETEWLYSAVALKLIESCHSSRTAELLSHDLKNRHL